MQQRLQEDREAARQQVQEDGGIKVRGRAQGCGLLKDQLCLYFIAKLVLSRGEEL